MSDNPNVGKVFNLTGGGMMASVYDPTGRRTNIYAYADALVKSAMDRLYENLLKEKAIYRGLCDSSGEAVLSSSGEEIEGRIVFIIR